MKILIYTEYFAPETNAAANRWAYFAQYLANQGHQVTVLTSFPHHPQGRIFPGYHNQWRKEEDKNGVKIIRCWTKVNPSRSFLSRLLDYLSFAWSSYRIGLSLGKFDVIVTTSPPLFTALAAERVARKTHTPLILDLRDLWPQAAVSTGYLKRGLWYHLSQKKAQQLYRFAKRILINSPAFITELEKEGISKDKVDFLPNGVDLNLFATGDSEFINKQYNLAKKFVVLYSGLLGFAQSPQILAQAAALLQGQPDVIFLVVGTGPLRQELEEEIKRLKLTNIILTGARPHKEIPSFIKRADVCLIIYNNKETFKQNIPSKIYEYMAGGKPIIINLEGEASKIIRIAGGGLVVSPAKPRFLVEAIQYLYNHPELSRTMGKNNLKYVTEEGDRAIISKKLENILKNVVKK